MVFVYHSQFAHLAACSWHVYYSWYYYQMSCFFVFFFLLVLATENRVWVQLLGWWKRHGRSQFLGTIARHLHQISINLSGGVLGPRTIFIWDFHGHSIYSGGSNTKDLEKLVPQGCKLMRLCERVKQNLPCKSIPLNTIVWHIWLLKVWV